LKILVSNENSTINKQGEIEENTNLISSYDSDEEFDKTKPNLNKISVRSKFIFLIN
jgi:hypothetical protein